MTDETIPVRLSHLLTHCAVGAIVRGPKHLVTVQDTRSWYPRGRIPADREIQYVEQIRGALGIQQKLCLPPVARTADDGEIEGFWIPAVRFPTWMRCPTCGLLHSRPWRDAQAGETLWCRRRAKGQCRQELEQAPWVLVHEAGYMTDAPWHAIAHEQTRSQQPPCRPDWNEPYLRLVEQEGQRRIQCTLCQATNELPLRAWFPSNAWQQPWIPEPMPGGSDDEQAWFLGVNDVRVHSAWTSAALVIPPESRIRKSTVVARMYSSSAKQHSLRRAKNRLARKREVRTLAQEWRCADADIEGALKEIDKGYPLYGQTFTDADLWQSEYKALLEPIPDLSDDEDFVTEHRTPAWHALADEVSGDAHRLVQAVSHLVEVRHLKAIMVMRGFQRIDNERTLLPDIDGSTGWLPALALHGEGVFFTLDEALLAQWERQEALQSRAEILSRRFHTGPKRRFAHTVDVAPRFLLLHTLAHLLIRHVETEAGYPAAALQERIYCAADPKPMAGILIYVAVPDEVGSLGGLASLAEPQRFLRCLLAVFEAAAWCSLDPVCAEHEGHGPDLLNRAACHACALLPETSCSYRNILLDRTFVKRDEQAGIRSLLDYAREN